MQCQFIVIGIQGKWVVCGKPAIGTVEGYSICIDCKIQMPDVELITVPSDPEEIDAEYEDLEVRVKVCPSSDVVS